VPLTDLPLPVLVALFLAIFVMIGVHPALRKAAQKIRDLLHSISPPDKPVAPLHKDVHAGIFADTAGTRQLNDYEIIVLRRLAQSGGKALSRKQVNAPLLFGDAVLHKTLRSLHRRGLLKVQLSTWFGQRFSLSKAGHRYALEQGYVIKIHERKGFLGKSMQILS
jgi:hypothetical protein